VHADLRGLPPTLLTLVVLANRSYAILNGEVQRVGASGAGTTARRMLDLSDPTLDFVALATVFGVPSSRVHTVGELTSALVAAHASHGPTLIEADLV
jgi:acetolactate synthase-1/2/3 large subunit